ncbi:Uncharacterised protein [Mycobacterium tuberculosis]|nr:Uncharacterised protein [Mycobacterium tuberculosis]
MKADLAGYLLLGIALLHQILHLKHDPELPGYQHDDLDRLFLAPQELIEQGERLLQLHLNNMLDELKNILFNASCYKLLQIGGGNGSAPSDIESAFLDLFSQSLQACSRI